MHLEKSNSGFFHRLYCALLNKYPFSGHEGIEGYYRNGSWEEFQKERLSAFRSAKIKTDTPLANYASIATIIGLVLSIAFYFTPFNDNSTNANRLISIAVLIILLGSISVLSILILLIWNDKKNYCLFYEQLLENNHDVLEKKLVEQGSLSQENYNRLLKLFETYNSILSESLHSLAEDFRTMLHFFAPGFRDETKGLESLTNFIDTLCEITSHYFLEYRDKIGTAFIDKYACCIKLIKAEQLYNNSTVDDLQVKTLIRSTKPVDEIYNARIQTYASRYDSQFDKISDNTDFNTIIRERRWYYYLSSFLEKVEKKTYKTSHPDGHEFYKSSVTFPIIYRYDDKKSVLLGFLCFDNYAVNAFPTCLEGDSERKSFSVESIEKWEGFCCSQVDFLSIAMARFLNLDISKSINNALALGPIRKAR